MAQKRKLVTEFQKKMDQEKILALYRQGKGLKSISKEIGTNHMAIKRALMKAGVYHNPQEPELTVTTQGNNEVTEDNQLCKTSDSQSYLGKYQKDLCKNWESCPVCCLEDERFKQLKELYLLGVPSPYLCAYFDIRATGLSDHAFAKNWHKAKAANESPERKRVIRQMIEDEAWKVVMESSSEGYAKDKLSGLKLLSELEGLGESEKSQVVSPGVVVNMRFSLNSGDQEQDIEEAINLLPEQNEENR